MTDRAGATHEITWEHAPGGVVAGRITCLDDVGGSCRQTCLDELGCEDRDHAHLLVDAGCCGVVAEAERLGAAALFDGPAGAPLRSGPIRTTRDAAGWTWTYLTQEAAAGSGRRGRVRSAA
ncbi:hypothetical protein [Kineococcus sp. SYSU DK003]|uniref:hypothetical protein n=1 Tax=Kineococcus sp. SYSU DK003 TaxID=3383124 RepID=UPI003D7D83D1